MDPSYRSVTAAQVGNYFVGQYYRVLQQNPDFVHQFYTDASALSVIDANVVQNATSMLQIHSAIMSMNFKTIEIKTAHSVKTLNNCVLVMVWGCVQTKELNVRRSFTQTFILAPQEKGYYILNDVFMFLDKEEIQQHTTTSLEHENYPTSLEQENYPISLEHENYPTSLEHENYPTSLEHENYNAEMNGSHPIPEPEITDYVLQEEFHKNGLVMESQIEEPDSVVDKYSIQEPQQPLPEAGHRLEEEFSVEESPASYAPQPPVSITREIPDICVEEQTEEPIKHTYASILQLKTSRALPKPTVPQTCAPSNVHVAPQWGDMPEPPQPQSFPQQSAVSEKPTAEMAQDGSLLEDEGEVTSVYVRNLCSSDTQAELEQVFKNFGKIKSGGVLIKCRKEVGVYYAFVEFEDLSGVHNAVQAPSIELNGRRIYAEERRPSAIASRGRRGRGRGGYQYESSRGRTGGRSFGGRGNSYMQHSARQDKGILGAQGVRNGHYASEFAS